MCDLVLDALQVLLLHSLVDCQVLLSVKEARILLDLGLEPFPDLAFEVRLASEAKGLPRVRFDCVESSAVLLVARESQAVFEDVLLDEIVFFVSDRAKS